MNPISSDAPSKSAVRAPQAQLTFARGVQKLTVTGGNFYSTSGTIRQQNICGGPEVNSRIIAEHHDHIHGEQDGMVQRNIRLFDAPEGNMKISGGLHILAEGDFIEESIGFSGVQFFNGSSNTENQIQQSTANAETDDAKRKQPPSHATLPLNPSTFANTTLFANAKGDINLTNATIVGCMGGATITARVDGASAEPISQTSIRKTSRYHDVDIHIFRGATITSNICGRHIIASGPIQVINYIS